MAILGLLLLAAAVVVGVEVGVSNTSDVGFEAFNTSFTAPLSVVFLIGALLMTVAILGLFTITGAFQRRRRLRVENKHRMRRTEARVGETQQTAAELAEENDRLRAELEAERRAAATMGGVAVPPGAGTPAYGDQVSDAVRSETISRTGHFDPYPADGTGRTIDVTGRDDRAERDAAEEKASVLGRFRHTD